MPDWCNSDLLLTGIVLGLVFALLIRAIVAIVRW
jgi:hypothetical protein